MILSVGKSKIIVQGGASQSVTVVDTNDAEMIYRKRKTSANYEERIFAELFSQDDNFITDDIDSILQDKSQSVLGQVTNYNTNYNASSIINKPTSLITYNQNNEK